MKKNHPTTLKRKWTGPLYKSGEFHLAEMGEQLSQNILVFISFANSEGSGVVAQSVATPEPSVQVRYSETGVKRPFNNRLNTDLNP